LQQIVLVQPDLGVTIQRWDYALMRGQRFGRYLGRCAALAVCTIPLHTAHASLHFSMVNYNIPTNFIGHYINVVTGQTGTNGGSVPGWTINPWGQSTLSFFLTNSPAQTEHVLRTGGGAVAI
jgi:hypothetical protein